MDIEAAAVRGLAAIDPYTLLDTEAARIDAFAEGLGSGDWAEPTGCAGWGRHDLLAHLAASETYNHACLDDTIDALMARAGAAGVTDLHGFNAWGVAERRDRPHTEVLQEWRVANARTCAGLRARDGWRPPHPGRAVPRRTPGVAPGRGAGHPRRRPRRSRRSGRGHRPDPLAGPVRPLRGGRGGPGAQLDHTNGSTTVRVGDASAVVDDETLVAAVSGRPECAPSTLRADVLAGLAPRGRGGERLAEVSRARTWTTMPVIWSGPRRSARRPTISASDHRRWLAQAGPSAATFRRPASMPSGRTWSATSSPTISAHRWWTVTTTSTPGAPSPAEYGVEQARHRAVRARVTVGGGQW